MISPPQKQHTSRVLLVDMAGSAAHAMLEPALEGLRATADTGFDRVSLVDVVRSAATDTVGALLERRSYELLVIAMPTRSSGLLSEVVQAVRARGQHTKLMLVGGVDSLEDMERASRAGADEFCIVPCPVGEVVLRIKQLLESRVTEDVDISVLKQKLGLRQLVGQSPGIARILQRLPVLACSGATLLIKGETGTGKELFARAIHYLSKRNGGPFVPVNCGAIPADLVENELFGHASGAFTGAMGARPGLVAEAEGGTLFLDEVDALPLPAQVKVLRLLQEKEFRPLGSPRSQQANLRIVAASNADLAQGVHQGKFRSDLYYRLDVLSLLLPPLRERTDDILLLAQHFLSRFAQQYTRGQLELTAGARRRLLEYDWPGNVRQLENVLERATILCHGARLLAQDIDIPAATSSEHLPGFQRAKTNAVTRFEREYLRQLLTLHRGNITQAARAAGKHRRALFELIRKHHIPVESFRTDDWQPAPHSASATPRTVAPASTQRDEDH